MTHDDEIHLLYFEALESGHDSVLICDVFDFAKHLIHLIYQFAFHIYVEMHLFDVVDAVDI